MKKRIVFFFLLGLIVACAPKNEYVMNGSVLDRDLDGKTIYIYRYTEHNELEMDSALIKNNKFQIKGVREEPAVFYAYIDAEGVYNSLAMGIPVLIKPGKITFEISGNNAKIGGNEENEAYQQLLDKQQPIRETLDKLLDQYQASATEEEKQRLKDESSRLLEEMKGQVVQFIYGNIDNPFGRNLFFDQSNLLTTAQINELLAMTDESFASHPDVVEILASRTKPKGKFTQGTKYMDFKSFNPQGNAVSLSDYVGKGKYVLIDFWASWCAPCIQEIPFLIDFYKEMNGENFEIVSVSLDKDKEAWLKAMQQLNMPWPQMSDLNASLPVIELYKVNAIPYTVLIDPEGSIIADNLRGEELETVIRKALNIISND